MLQGSCKVRIASWDVVKNSKSQGKHEEMATERQKGSDPVKRRAYLLLACSIGRGIERSTRGRGKSAQARNHRSSTQMVAAALTLQDTNDF
jgi:hypothetical protein